MNYICVVCNKKYKKIDNVMYLNTDLKTRNNKLFCCYECKINNKLKKSKLEEIKNKIIIKSILLFISCLGIALYIYIIISLIN